MTRRKNGIQTSVQLCRTPLLRICLVCSSPTINGQILVRLNVAETDTTFSSHIFCACLWLFLFFLLFSTLIPFASFISPSPVLLLLGFWCLHHAAQQNLIVVSLRRPSCPLHVCMWQNCLCSQRLSICVLHKSLVLVIRRYLWEGWASVNCWQKGGKDGGSDGGKKCKEWQREMIEDGEEQMHKAFTPSSYYQLAFRAGWGCHGDGRPSWLGVLLTQ